MYLPPSTLQPSSAPDPSSNFYSLFGISPTAQQQQKSMQSDAQSEAEAILEWKKQQISKEIAMEKERKNRIEAENRWKKKPKNNNDTYRNHAQNLNHIFHILSELESEKITPIMEESREAIKPRYLLALFKNTEKERSRTLFIDKLNLRIEWFEPLISVPEMPVVPDDPRTAQLVKLLQSEKKKTFVPSIPRFLADILETVRKETRQRDWKIWTNRVPNKQLSQTQNSDYYSLWYAMMRLGYNRQGGPYEPDALDKLALPYENACQLDSEFLKSASSPLPL
jgi:hypothetical protein